MLRSSAAIATSPDLATERLGLPRDRYVTLLELVRSQLDISIANLLDT